MRVERDFVRAIFVLAMVAKLRTLGQFAEEEIRLTSGPHENLRFKLSRHPVAALLFKELERGVWRRAFVTGPNQDGKTVMSFVIFILYLLFERCERVVMGSPNDAIANDKWQLDLKPMIESTRYAGLLPSDGGGARGGMPEMLQFGNGAVLRSMTAGGNDQSRSHFTSPNVVVTEAEAFDQVGSNSREGSKFAQLEKRNLGFGEQAFTLGECTVGTEEGITWQEYMKGSRSRIALPCPHCSNYVTPEREHFIGWQDAKSELEAMELARIHCPECGCAWTNEERLEANRRGVIAHGDQKIGKDGNVITVDENGNTEDRNGRPIGALPPTRTLGFRWTCVNAAVNPERMKLVAAKEWKAKRAEPEDEETLERDLCQVEWVTPAKSEKQDVSGLNASRIMSRVMHGIGKGVLPANTIAVTLGADIGKHLIHWVAIAWLDGGGMHIADYDIEEVPLGSLDEEAAIELALTMLRERAESGWVKTDKTTVIKPAMCFVDAGYYQSVVIEWCRAAGHPWFATKGYGVLQKRTGEYKRETGSKVISDPKETDHYAVIELPNGDELVEIDVDHWKTVFHRRLSAPIQAIGGFTLPDGMNHVKYVKHCMAERRVQRFVPGTGLVTSWETVNKNNHLGDASILAQCAAHPAGIRFGQPMTATNESDASAAVDSRQPTTGWINAHRDRY
jgi:phage terminase large subunit GpA-like protein